MEATKLIIPNRDAILANEIDRQLLTLLKAHVPTVIDLMDKKKFLAMGDVLWTDISRMSFYVRASITFGYRPKYVNNIQKVSQEDFDKLPDNQKYLPTNPTLYLHIEGLSGGPIICNAEVDVEGKSVKIIGEITRTQNLGVTNFHDVLTVFERLQKMDLLKDSTYYQWPV